RARVTRLRKKLKPCQSKPKLFSAIREAGPLPTLGQAKQILEEPAPRHHYLDAVEGLCLTHALRSFRSLEEVHEFARAVISVACFLESHTWLALCISRLISACWLGPLIDTPDVQFGFSPSVWAS
ncbi:unnamed protein product, partial [Ectocarpus sp. 12 AP-2014]